LGIRFFGGSGSSRESGGFLKRVTMVWVSSLSLLSHSWWSLRKKNVEHAGLLSLFYRTYITVKNGVIINAPSFWPFFPISQKILWPGLGVVKLESLPLKTFWIKVFLMFLYTGMGDPSRILELDSPCKKGSKGKLVFLRGVFSFYPGIPR
jgi:hypothetical protein